MTTEAYPGASSYTISGTGPYNIGHEYSDDADIACIVLDDIAGTRVVLDAADFSISPAGPADDGDVTLTTDAATTHDGLKLIINRETILENGWEAVQGPREEGLEAQLDRLTRAAQDASRTVLASLRADRALNPFVPVEGAVIGFDANLQPISIFDLVETAASAYMATLLLSADRAALLSALGGNLAIFDALEGATDKLPYFAGPSALSLATFTSTARALLAGVDADAMKTVLEIFGEAVDFDVSMDADFGIDTDELADRSTIAAYIASRNWNFSPVQVPAGGETAFDFTGIPPGVNEVCVVLNNIDAGADRCQIQFGTASGWVVSGYTHGSGSYFGNATGGGGISTTETGWTLRSYGAGNPILATTRWSRIDPASHFWSGGGPFAAGNGMGDVAGSITLAEELTRIRVQRDGASSFLAQGSLSVGWRF